MNAQGWNINLSVTTICLLMTNRMKNNYISEFGQRHHEYLRKNKRDFLCGFQLSREIYNYFANIDYQAEEMFSLLVTQPVLNVNEKMSHVRMNI